MGQGSRRLLIGLGSAAVAGVTVLSLAPVAGASTGSLKLVNGRAAVAVVAQPGSVYVPTEETLRFGMHGSAVRALQKRLNFLHYYAGKADGKFGWDTMEAVWAFKEVQAGKAEPKDPDIVGPATQRELAKPKLPKVLIKGAHWTRIEVNKDIGVLVLYYGKKIRLISHVSTAAACRPDGCGWITPDGTYRALWFAPGWVGGPLGSMWNPVVFTPDGAYAIHGEPNPPSTFSPDGVPLNAASHGCVRIPMDIANFFHKLIHVSQTNGTLIYIRGHDQDYSGI
ncbi:MAG TPA: L,D-transpeptidase family protein [Streptosporangiaceae bacterium]|nr:L,D-transpeptidase family protein [Streptosporangiaceae bacterium]